MCLSLALTSISDGTANLGLEHQISWILRPQPEHSSLRFPRLRRTHRRSVLASSLISLR